MIIHKKCNAKVKSFGKGDWGICTKCGKRVDHLLIDAETREVIFSDEVSII